MSAGGDVAVRGVPAQGIWPVAVDDELTLGIERGGLATSGRDRRRWRRGGEERHHLIDPATGRPAETDLLRVTAVGRDAVEAEVLAKTLFLGGLAVRGRRGRRRRARRGRRKARRHRRSRLMHHDPTFWLLARASGVTAYVVLTLSVLAGLVVKSRPFARLRAATVTEIHKSLALTGLGAIALHGTSLVLDSTVKVSLAALARPRPRRVPPARGRGGCPRRVAASQRSPRRSGCGSASARAPGGGCTGSRTRSSHSRPSTASPPGPTRLNRGVHALYLGAVGAVAAATVWRALVPPARRAVMKGAST